MSNKPFCKLLKNPAGCFMYDVNTNKLIRISEKTYRVLQIMETNDTKLHMPEIVSLQKNGFLKPNCLSRIEKYSEKVISFSLNFNVNSLLLQVTRNCNMRCNYCFYSGLYKNIRTHQDKTMSIDTCKKTIDFFFEKAKCSPSVNIGFYGGEPLLNFNVIKEAIEHIKRQYGNKKVYYSITTNGTLLTDEMVAFFINHNFKITISIDGPAEIHNHNRVFADGRGTYESVINNLICIKNRNTSFFENNVRYNAVITSDRSKVESFFCSDDLLGLIQGKLSPLNDYHENSISNSLKTDRANVRMAIQNVSIRNCALTG